MIDSITGLFEIIQYKDKNATKITNLVETEWLTRYPCTVEVMYDQGSELIGNKF